MNIAYIDSQNMHLATITALNPWAIDMRKLRVYLERRFDVEEAYLFIGAYDQKHQDMYEEFQRAGYILIYREHSANLKGKKKGNVDVDIVFQVMRDLKDRDDLDKVVLVSGDGDYKRMVDYLVKNGRLEKLLLPSHHNASSLYKQISSQNYIYMDTERVRSAIEQRQ